MLKRLGGDKNVIKADKIHEDVRWVSYTIVLKDSSLLDVRKVNNKLMTIRPL